MEQHNLRTLIVDRASERDAYGIITATDISQAVANAKDPQLTFDLGDRTWNVNSELRVSS